ncbi:recombinase family protein [Streptomyces sp. SP17KL33]|uniref:recombinase family protein n=1 Tax=Streptomyces sp. SP17KL33 TaxID=3002534 RepID=UPI002E778084|nr:recombinase family protein [Streptomyces sp. SP17KL33]MEE1835751.1 recombinase family protein [Streptomyces sp. SP17KL33]
MPAYQDWSDASAPDHVRVIYYVRQSHKNETDSMSSPLAQQRSCEAYIASQPGWKLVKEGGFADIGISGYDPNAYRPGYEEMMQWVKDGKCDVVVIFALSRLTRQGAKEALRIHSVMAEKGVALVSTTEPFINTSHDNPFSVAFFALIAALAEQESRNKSEFIRNSFKELQERGSHSSGPVPWWAESEPMQVDGVTIRRLKPHSAPVRQKALARMLELAEAGKAGNAIAEIMTEEKIPIPSELNPNLAANLVHGRTRRKGGEDDDSAPEWSSTVVLRTLRDPRLAGFAIRSKPGNKNLKREILYDDNGQPVAPHVAAIAPVRWFQLQERLDGRKKERTVPKDGGEMTLLGSWGIQDCGKCASPMTVARTSGTYVCNLRRAVNGVEKHTLRIDMSDADKIVAQRVWNRITALDPENLEDAALLAEAARRFAHNNANPEIEAERLAVKAQLEHVQGSIAQTITERSLYKGPTGRSLWAEQMEKLANHEEECTTRLQELEDALNITQAVPLDAWTGGADHPMDDDAPWAKWSTEERRGFLSIWVDRVTVAPAPPRAEWGNSRDPEAGFKRAESRIDIVWAKPPKREEAHEAEAV